MSSEEENNFDQRYCPWEMVTGASGTFLRVIDVVHDLGDWFGYEDINANDFMRSWYYDNAIPSSLGDSGAPEHPNKWSLCSATVDNQVIKSIFFSDFVAILKQCVYTMQLSLRNHANFTARHHAFLKPIFFRLKHGVQWVSN